jgi:RecJ-like exonuclease
MRIEDHLAKAQRIENTMLRKLDSVEDYEIFVETFMLAGTHLLNAVLHRTGITSEHSDLVHSYLPKLESPVGPQAAEIITALKYIENLRPGYLRGDVPWAPQDGENCLANYRRIKRITQQCVTVG